MTFSHGSNSLEKARYEKMFSMFTDESVKSIKYVMYDNVVF